MSLGRHVRQRDFPRRSSTSANKDRSGCARSSFWQCGRSEEGAADSASARSSPAFFSRVILRFARPSHRCFNLIDPKDFPGSISYKTCDHRCSICDPFRKLVDGPPASTTYPSLTNVRHLCSRKIILMFSVTPFIKVTQEHKDLHEVPAGRSRAH